MEGELQNALGRNLRNFREAEELSQEAFAERLGFHRTYMAGIERGERNLTLRSVEKIADKLKIEPLLLLAGPIPRGRRNRRGALGRARRFDAVRISASTRWATAERAAASGRPSIAPRPIAMIRRTSSTARSRRPVPAPLASLSGPFSRARDPRRGRAGGGSRWRRRCGRGRERVMR